MSRLKDGPSSQPTNAAGNRGWTGAVSKRNPYPLTVEVGELVAVPGLQHPGPRVDTFLESSPEGGHRMDPEILAGGAATETASQEQSRGVERPGCEHHRSWPER